jgi:hypothetical protein
MTTNSTYVGVMYIIIIIKNNYIFQRHTIKSLLLNCDVTVECAVVNYITTNTSV